MRNLTLAASEELGTEPEHHAPQTFWFLSVAKTMQQFGILRGCLKFE
jgi:hypothetical protein